MTTTNKPISQRYRVVEAPFPFKRVSSCSSLKERSKGKVSLFSVVETCEGPSLNEFGEEYRPQSFFTHWFENLLWAPSEACNAKSIGIMRSYAVMLEDWTRVRGLHRCSLGLYLKTFDWTHVTRITGRRHVPLAVYSASGLHQVSTLWRVYEMDTHGPVLCE